MDGFIECMNLQMDGQTMFGVLNFSKDFLKI